MVVQDIRDQKLAVVKNTHPMVGSKKMGQSEDIRVPQTPPRICPGDLTVPSRPHLLKEPNLQTMGF